MPSEEFKVRVGDKEYMIEFNKDKTEIVIINGREVLIEAVNLNDDIISLILDGKSYLFNISSNGETYNIVWNGGEVNFEIEDERTRLLNNLIVGSAGRKSRKRVRAPMPGLVVKIIAGIGDDVKKGDPLVVVEAMKMENEISSPSDGKVAEIMIKEGHVVEKEEVMITLEG